MEIDVPRPVPRPSVPDPRPVDLLPVYWTIITPDTIPEGTEWSIIGLIPDQYEALSKNMAELLRWITEAGYRLRYYKGEISIEEIPQSN